MRRSLRYMDAVKLLAGGENQLVKLLDEASATMLLGTGVFDLFEAREQALRLLEKVLDKFAEKLRGVDRLTRTERIYAAHEIIRITAYFDAFSEAMGEWRVRFSAVEQAQLASGVSDIQQWRKLYEVLSQPTYPLPFFDKASTTIFGNLSRELLSYVQWLAVWDSLDQTDRDLLAARLTGQVPQVATLNYHGYLRRLSVDCPEFGVWLNLQAHAETRHDITTGLTELEQLLAPLRVGLSDGPSQSLNRAYRAVLIKPIVHTEGPDSGLAPPSLGEGYVNHRFRLAFAGFISSRHWDDQEIREDLPGTLGAYLMSPHSRTVPLVVLGQPGSGKSILTRILAARLPAERFLPIRIELRHVNADSDLQDYVESAIRDQTGDHVQWTPFVNGQPERLPVVILDGFDELLQATGVTQTDFLQRIERFQERELDQGRSVAVIVTTRTAVADRAVIPDGAPIIRLEPFDDRQIATWIDIWNRKNGPSLAQRGVSPLSTDTFARYRDLAEQPLLLLMLALYDAADNALATIDPDLDQGSVYERLLTEFARRELLKDPGITEVERHVEVELLRLSVVAFAMFNRGAQWVGDESLTEDFKALGIWESPPTEGSLRSALTTGQKITGRFFFVHGAKAMRGDREVQTYEFLHATFGEYLIARLVNRLLGELAAHHEALHDTISYTANDSMPRALLSFDCLASRAPIMDFLTVMIDRWSPEKRASVTSILITLFHAARDGRPSDPFPDYQPVRVDLVNRYATWRANLVLLAVTVGGSMTSEELFPGDRYGWAPEASTWYGQLSSEGWTGLVERVKVKRIFDIGERTVRLSRPDFAPSAVADDLRWTFRSPGKSSAADAFLVISSERTQESANFLTDHARDIDVHSLLPLSRSASAVSRSVLRTDDGRMVSAGHALLAALFAPFKRQPVAHETTDLLAFATRDLASFDSEKEAFRKAAAGLLVSAAEYRDFPEESYRDLLGLIETLGESRHKDVLLQRMTALMQAPTTPTPPALAASPLPAPSPAASSPATRATPPAAP